MVKGLVMGQRQPMPPPPRTMSLARPELPAPKRLRNALTAAAGSGNRQAGVEPGGRRRFAATSRYAASTTLMILGTAIARPTRGHGTDPHRKAAASAQPCVKGAEPAAANH